MSYTVTFRVLLLLKNSCLHFVIQMKDLKSQYYIAADITLKKKRKVLPLTSGPILCSDSANCKSQVVVMLDYCVEVE